MNEEQWLTCTDPTQMLVFLLTNRKANENRLLLWENACRNWLWPRLSNYGRQKVQEQWEVSRALVDTQTLTRLEAALAVVRWFEEEPAVPCAILHDLIGNPFRPSLPLPPAVLAWKNGMVCHLAEDIYKERRMPEGTLDPARLATLANALAAAGCTDAELLGHLRSPDNHVRGCFAVDVVLGRK